VGAGDAGAEGRLAVVADAILGVVEIGAVLDRGRVGVSRADDIQEIEGFEPRASRSARPGGGSGLGEYGATIL